MTANEDCDDMGESATCDSDCTIAECGDMIVNMTAMEECDDGGDSSMCDGDCTAVSCGDSYANSAAGEQCDDGNTADGDGCDSMCITESCIWDPALFPISLAGVQSYGNIGFHKSEVHDALLERVAERHDDFRVGERAPDNRQPQQVVVVL